MDNREQNELKMARGFCLLMAWRRGDPKTIGDVVAEAVAWSNSVELEGLSLQELKIYHGNEEAVASKLRRDLSRMALAGNVDSVVLAGGVKGLGESRAFAEQMGIRVIEKPRKHARIPICTNSG
ncbi:MAG: hypothetical protein QGH51_08980 [Planctomycetota bacterium]|jgi:hypothetical protein|nr:hypothetical protein [Planctomycetota bacterium]MDP6942143.1 hypothetical protein [Planctomycetota bacterium]